MGEIEYGYCHCGCGKKTTVPTVNQKRFGRVKGQPLRFVHGHNRKPVIPLGVKFWAKVDKSQECWEWTASKHFSGYGEIGYLGKKHKAHRISWMIHHGEIPEGLYVLHKCDNPACVNPDHLFLGTHNDNMADKMQKGRCSALKGESNGESRLTEQQVKEIRALYPSFNQIKIGKMFNVSNTTISKIVRRESWRHI